MPKGPTGNWMPRPATGRRKNGESKTCSTVRPEISKRPIQMTARLFRSSSTGTGIMSCWRWRLGSSRFIINDYWANALLLALPDLCHRGHRAEHSGGLLRAGQPGHRGVHGCGGLCLLQADDRLSRCQHVHPCSAGGWASRRLWACCSACHPCASKGSIWRWRRWRRSSFWCGSSTGCRGSTIIRPRARSTHPNVTCSASSSPAQYAAAWATYLFCLIFLTDLRHRG